MLVTRLVPCPRCLASHNEHEENLKRQRVLQGHGGGGGGDWRSELAIPRSAEDEAVVVAEEVRVSQDSAASDRDSGVGEQDMDGAKASSEDKAEADKVGGSIHKTVRHFLKRCLVEVANVDLHVLNS